MRHVFLVVLSILVGCLVLSSTSSGAPKPEKSDKTVPEVRAVRINPHKPVIDGILDDEIWGRDKNDVATGFIQVQPDEGYAATETTLVAVRYDDEAIYVAFWNYDSEPDEIKTQLVRRDRWCESDWVTVQLDPYHDHQSGYRFELNASGVQCDVRLYNDTNRDRDWDAVWEGAAARQPWGWSAEFRIPYHCLRFADKKEHTWGMNLTRYISRKGEFDSWAFSPSTEGGYVSQFGHLTDIKGIKPARHLEILPYTVSKLETEPGHPGNEDGREAFGNLGVDIKYGIFSNLTLDATVNPDFGQVELDRPVLNLSAFETWYSEKRPFFLEGAGMFDTRFSLFYSRRIGRPPRGYPDDLDFYRDRPIATTILAAAKITGKLGDRTSLAVLSAVTDEEVAKYVSTSGDIRHAVVEPTANYSVFRLQREILKSSSVGFLGTLASRDGEYPATTGGVDWTLTTNNAAWGTGGQVVFSRVDNENVGFGITGAINKHAGKHWRGAIGGTIKDPHFDVNDLGFTSRNGIRNAWIWQQYRTQDDWWIFRNTYHNVNGSLSWNYDGVNIDRGWNYNNWIEFTNYWGLGGGVHFNSPDYDDFETRGNGLWERPKSWGWWASLHTDQRKSWSINLNPGSGEGRNGSWWSYYTGVELRPAVNMEFEFGINVERAKDYTRWVSNVTDPLTDELVSVFADLDQDEVSARFSSSVTLSRTLSWQISGQLLLTGLDYSNYRRYVGGEDYAPLGEIEFGERDFNYVALNSTMILRWEYRPGSTLYVVWTRQSEGDTPYNNLAVRRDLDTAFSGDARNVFLVKASYWWNM